MKCKFLTLILGVMGFSVLAQDFLPKEKALTVFLNELDSKSCANGFIRSVYILQDEILRSEQEYSCLVVNYYDEISDMKQSAKHDTLRKIFLTYNWLQEDDSLLTLRVTTRLFEWKLVKMVRLLSFPFYGLRFNYLDIGHPDFHNLYFVIVNGRILSYTIKRG